MVLRPNLSCDALRKVVVSYARSCYEIFEMSRGGSDWVGSGRIGSDRAGSGRVGSGRVGSGRVTLALFDPG